MEQGGPLIQYDWCHIKGGNVNTATNTGRTPCDDEGEIRKLQQEPRDARDCQQTARSWGTGLEQVLPRSPRKEPILLTPCS